MDDQKLIQEKIEQATKILDEFDVDLWLTFVRETMLQPDPSLELIYNGDVTWQSAFMICRDGRHVAIAGHFDTENILNLGVYQDVIGYHEDLGTHLREQLAAKNPRTIAINYSQNDVAADGLTFGMYENLKRYLTETPYCDRLISAEKIIAALRGRKSPLEISRVRQAVATTEKLFDEVEEFARPGMTQEDIATFVRGEIDGRGLGYAWPRPFNPIVTCGPDSAVGHAAPGQVRLERGHTLHLDLGIKENAYCSDIQRMWYVLKEGETEAPPDVQRAFAVVLGLLRQEKPL